MDENLKEVNLDHVGSKSISEILREVSGIDDLLEKSSKLDFHVRALEEELRKIDALRRELPNSMQLLNDAIERLKEEMGKEIGPAMEEFMRFKSNNGEGDGRAKLSNYFRENKNWISSVQLWSTPVHYENYFFTRNQDNSVLHLKSRYQDGQGKRIVSEFQGCKFNFKNRTGAFVPFKKPSGVTMREEKGTAPVSLRGLSLSIPVAEVESNNLSEKRDCGFGRTKLQQLQQQEQERKQRRCWTAELHRRFVDALDQLGGAQRATPKHIREIMKVVGLTNDEVKSHLQKYRTHIRKSGCHSNYPWLASDQRGHLSKLVTANSGSPQVGSATGGESIEHEVNEKSESHGLKNRLQKPTEQRL